MNTLKDRAVAQRIWTILLMVQVASTLWVTPSPAVSPKPTRFFHSGDGLIRLASEKNSKTFKGSYRGENGRYKEDAYRAISGVFGVTTTFSDGAISLRLIEFLDYLQDRLGPGALITITSGYRAPEYNANLRRRGALAAKASLHQYGMAADFFIEGVPSKRIWNYVKALGFGGTGYYHGKTVHVDVGPARFWDEKSSGVGSGLSDDNKLIGLATDFDYYAPGQMVTMRFIRMTAFPIQVHSEFDLVALQQGTRNQAAIAVRPKFSALQNGLCSEFTSIGQMSSFRWVLPSALPPGRYQIRAHFCGETWRNMPENVSTPQFEVRMP
jgi:uncharacterized protein YcbK (DUF882 family)